jgi:membrane-associated protease RseP (regulator of RpoE activity)
LDNQQTPERPGGVIPPAGAPVPPNPREARANGILFVLVAAALIFGLYQLLGPDGVLQVFKAALGLGLVIFLHELGHFAVAKWCDVHVQTFSIGFGPALPGCSFQRGETTYKIAMIPLGGYVKMVGEGAETDESDDDPRSFKNKTVGQRMAIISAGVVMNVILGAVCFILAYQGGLKQPPAIVGQIEPGSPAYQKQSKSGDIVLKIENEVAKDAEGNPVQAGASYHATDFKSQPGFDDMRFVVMLTSSGEEVPVIYGRPTPSGDKIVALPQFNILPRKTPSDNNPVIGIRPPEEMRLLLKRYSGRGNEKRPPVYGAAAAARELMLGPGDVVTATTDPSHDDRMKPLPPQKWPDGERTDYFALTLRFEELAGKPIRVVILRKRIEQLIAAQGLISPSIAGPAFPQACAALAVAHYKKHETVELGETGFQYGDLIVGTTDADLAKNTPYDPYRVAPLPDDPRNPEPGHPDFFIFSERMQRLAGKPVVLQVRREDASPDDPPVPVLVPVAYHRAIPGLRMRMGKVKALRDDSPAARAGVQPDDRLETVELTDGTKVVRYTSAPDLLAPLVASFAVGPAGISAPVLPQALAALKVATLVKAGVEEHVLDPVRLTHDLRVWVEHKADSKARADGKIKARLVVLRPNQWAIHKAEERTELPAAKWDESWRFNMEAPLSLASPLSIPELGVAYQVETRVDSVEDGSPADKAGLRKDDVVLAVSFKFEGKENEKWSPANELYRKEKSEPEPWWASIFWVYQSGEVSEVKLLVQRDSGEEEIVVTPKADPTWPSAERGLRLMPELRLQKADSPLDALVLGLKRTKMMIVNTYRGIVSMVTFRISPIKSLRGPIRIAHIAFDIAGEDFPQFMAFLAIISVNLAVINFLPIPVLDGGHMVFLIYEKLRGRPASEQVRLGLTYAGLLLILSLMVFVIYLDVKSYLFG